MVIVQMADDASYHPCEDLASAISMMERFRNEEGVESLELFQMSPVSFEFKTYYQVEIDNGSVTQTQSAPEVASSLSAVTPLAEVPAAPAQDAPAEAAVEQLTAPVVSEPAAELPSPWDTPAEPAAEAVEVPTAADQSVVPFPTAPAAPAEALLPPIPPAPAVAVPAPAEAVESGSMFGQTFESEEDPFLAAQPAEAPAEAGNGLGFELSPQSDPAASPFNDAPAVDSLSAEDVPPPPPPPGEDILAEMAEMADTKATEPRRGLFGR